MFYSFCLYNLELVPDEVLSQTSNPEINKSFLTLRLLGFSALDGYVQSARIGRLNVAFCYFPDYASFAGYILEVVRESVIGIYLAVTTASAE